MTLIKTALAAAFVLVVVAAAANTYGISGNEISRADQWDVTVAAPFGATGIADIDIIF